MGSGVRERCAIFGGMPVLPLVRTLDRRLPRWVPCLALLALSGCSSLGYYGQLASGQLRLLAAREPVAEVVDDPARDAALRQRLRLAQEARAFASAELGLPDNRSYRLYSDIRRPYVVWNVFATPELSLQPLTHCFPIAGCVAYRGYYDEAAARAEARRLQGDGMDVHVGGVEAYSTLGWFDDPILSSMLRWGDQRLAETIFHELAHQRFYLPGDTAFNESYASFVEREGGRRWRAAQGLPAQDSPLAAQRDALARLVLDTRERLQKLYASGRPAAELRAGKAAEFDRLRREYRALRDREWGGKGPFDAWIEAPLNNAKLLPFGLYDQWVPAFAELFRQLGGNWPAFHARVEKLAALPASERHAALERLDAGQPYAFRTPGG
ncbi:putative aminopeptidase [compost metagenome]|uniref:Predicted aminopeptidase n=2 Tax=Pseudomonas jinjuensis TaxID=198616 RepID=A0A1H0C5J0_9PSED|nr:Predicted aminopeptidase [Pseudomonas jinjuensis]